MNATPPTPRPGPRYGAPDPRPRPASEFGFDPPPAPASPPGSAAGQWTGGGPPAGLQPSAPPPPSARDRLAVHLAWEVVLAFLLVVLVVISLINTEVAHIGNVVSQAGPIGLMASGLALSLRTGTPNLAVGAIAAFTGGLAGYMITQGGWETSLALIVSVVLATLLGAVIGLAVAALSVPAWAVTLAGAALIEALVLGITDARVMPAPFLSGYPTALWFTLFVVVSVGGGLLWWKTTLRERLSATRDHTDPGKWGGMEPALGAFVGITGSAFLAALGGVALLMRLSTSPGVSGLSMTIIALAAALFGGASLYGRRAGIAGTVLGVLIVTGVISLLAYYGVSAWLSNFVVALFAVLGLGVVRLIEWVTVHTATPAPVPAQDRDTQ